MYHSTGRPDSNGLTICSMAERPESSEPTMSLPPPEKMKARTLFRLSRSAFIYSGSSMTILCSVSPAATRYCLLPVSNTAYIHFPIKGSGYTTTVQPRCQPGVFFLILASRCQLTFQPGPYRVRHEHAGARAGAKEVWFCTSSGEMSFFSPGPARPMPTSMLCPEFPTQIELS